MGVSFDVFTSRLHVPLNFRLPLFYPLWMYRIYIHSQYRSVFSFRCYNSFAESFSKVKDTVFMEYDRSFRDICHGNTAWGTSAGLMYASCRKCSFVCLDVGISSVVKRPHLHVRRITVEPFLADLVMVLQLKSLHIRYFYQQALWAAKVPPLCPLYPFLVLFLAHNVQVLSFVSSQVFFECSCHYMWFYVVLINCQFLDELKPKSSWKVFHFYDRWDYAWTSIYCSVMDLR